MTREPIDVLLVEDNPDHAELMQRVLKRHPSVGSVTAVSRGSDCLKMLSEHNYSVLLLDYSLPGTDGLTVLKEIRQRGYPVPVVMVTSQGVERVAVEAMEEGASDYVIKAAGYLTTLPTMISKVLKQHELATENRRLLEATQRQGRQMALIFASTSDGIVLLNQDGTVAEANGRAEEFFDRPGLMVGRNFLEIVAKASPELQEAERFGRQVDELLTSGANGDGLIEFGTPTPLILHWAARPTLDETGERLGLTLTFRDVTREREIDRMKTEFISTVSHELRTPLTSVKGALQLVMDDPDVAQNPLQAELLGICLNNTDRLIRLINDILDISKIESGRIQLRLDTHSVEEFVLTAVEGVRALAAQRGIALETALAEDLPAVAVDLDRMVQVVTNLLSNAIKFSPEGQRVCVEADEVEGEVVIRVRDWGKGIAPEEMPRLFKKFQQLDSSAVREAGGTGLGLAISKGIIEEHAGKIWVDSEVGVGSCFAFHLPAATAPARHDARLVPGRSAAASGFKKKRVLVVDDEADIRYIIRQHLERLGHEVVEAQSGLEAIEKVRALRPDLITLDVMMPDMDGFDVMAVLKEREGTRTIPVIFLSVVQDEAKGFRLGATDYITKPIDPDRLLRAIERILPQEERHAPPRVLVVDDDLEILTILGRILGRAGYAVAQAQDGQQGLSKIYTEAPDLVILDIQMPGMSGYEVIRRIRGTRRLANLPILVLTASDAGDRATALALGATEYLTKPFSADVLLLEITRLIKSVDGQSLVPAEQPTHVPS